MRTSADLRLFADTGSGGGTVLAAAGTWGPQASLLQAGIDDGAGTMSNLRERLWLFLRSGRLTRVDLEDGSATLARVSTLIAAELCTTMVDSIGEVFGDWTQPTRSVIVQQTNPDCRNDIEDLWSLQYVAVRADMAPTDAPIARGAERPLATLRDRRGAITGDIVYGGQTLATTDASFGDRRLIDTNVAPFDDRLGLIGVYGTDADPCLPCTYQPWLGSDQVRAFPLDGAGGSRTLFSTPILSDVVADERGVFVTAAAPDDSEGRLLRIEHDLSAVVTLSGLVPPGRIALAPSRVPVWTNDSVASFPPGAAERELLSLGGRFIDRLHVVGDDICLQARGATSGTTQDATVIVAGTDLGNRVDMPTMAIIGTLLPAQSPLARRHCTAPRLAQVVAVQPDDNSAIVTLRNAALKKIGAARAEVLLRRLPDIGSASWLQPVADAAGAERRQLDGQHLDACQQGQSGLLTIHGADTHHVDTGAGGVTRLTAFR